MSQNTPTTIRIPNQIYAKASEAAEKMGLPLADVLRQSIALGLHDLALVNYDVDQIIYNAVLQARSEAGKKK